MQELSEQMGITRQALYKRKVRYDMKNQRQEMVIAFAKQMRHSQNRIGMKKLYRMFKAEHQECGIGRDRFIEICQKHKLTYNLQHKKRYKSADMKGEKLSGVASNLVPKGLLTLRPNVIWCSDITYLKADNKHVYLSLVIDYHSRKIIGWHVSETMETINTIKALEQALRQVSNPKGIIHHSDRGSQYRSELYQKHLKLYGMTPSMTDGGKPYQNARVERINGILKHEFGLVRNFENIHILRASVAEAIFIYNTQRLHTSLGYLTPDFVHQNDNKISSTTIKSVNLI
jgi:transposase InsO family protein